MYFLIMYVIDKKANKQSVCVCVCTHGSRRRGSRGAGERDHLLDGQTQFEAVQWVADADLSLDLGVRQGRHDGPAFYVGTTRCDVPCWHPQPQL